MVELLELKGHKAPILSLAHSSQTISKALNDKKGLRKRKAVKTAICHLLSGDEKGQTRIWDLRYNSYRASHCIIAPSEAGAKEVTAVGFHPMLDTDFPSQFTQGSYPFTIYTAVGAKIYGYDLRYTKDPIISEYDFNVPALDGGEEINVMDFFHQTKQRNTFLATVDDDGILRVTNQIKSKKGDGERPEHSFNRKYEHSEEGCPSLATSLAFRPRSIKSIDVVTGGTDYTISLWDVNRPHNQPSSTLVVSRDNDENSDKAGVNQLCNPPIVHSLSWSPSGQLLSAGLGDGTVLIASIVDGRKLVERCRLRNGHDSAVASVLFPAFGNNITNTASHDRQMISAGTDGKILIWDLGSKIGGKSANDPRRTFEGCCDSGIDGNVSDALKNLSLLQKNVNPEILFGIPHGKKINYMTNSSCDEVALSNSLFVADTSNNVSVYTLPIIR